MQNYILFSHMVRMWLLYTATYICWGNELNAILHSPQVHGHTDLRIRRLLRSRSRRDSSDPHDRCRTGLHFLDNSFSSTQVVTLSTGTALEKMLGFESWTLRLQLCNANHWASSILYFAYERPILIVIELRPIHIWAIRSLPIFAVEIMIILNFHVRIINLFCRLCCKIWKFISSLSLYVLTVLLYTCSLLYSSAVYSCK